MLRRTRKFHLPVIAAVVALAIIALPLASWAQTENSTANSTASPNKDRWLHVRVQGSQGKNENVRVNIPLDLAAKVLGAITDDHLSHGKIKIDASQSKDIDIRALFDAIHTAKDGEFVTVQDNDSDVRVAKQAGYFLVHVHDRNKGKDHGKAEQVEIRIPMKVAEAMLSATDNELDILAAVRALSSQGDTELVSVKSDDETVRIWLDSKNLSN